jgi:transcriptional regulator
MEGKSAHIPLELEATKDGKHILQGHIAKENPQWKGFKEDDTVLTIFQGHTVTFPPLGMTTKCTNMELFGRSCLRKIKIIEGEAVIESLKN